MPHPVRISLKQAPPEGAPYPFSVPQIRTLPQLDTNNGVTFFVGENGSGKSTLFEGIAAAAELPALGSADVAVDDTMAPARQLGAALRLAWSPRSRQGFFLRAEDFFGYHKARARLDARIIRERLEGRVVPGEPVIEAGSAIHPDERDAAASSPSTTAARTVRASWTFSRNVSVLAVCTCSMSPRRRCLRNDRSHSSI